MNSRLDYIDSLRGFAMLLVIYGHALSGLGFGVSVARGLIYSFHMPLFFTISGFVISYSFQLKHSGGGGLSSTMEFLRFAAHKIMTILVPYLVWCLAIRPFVYGREYNLGLILGVLRDNTALWFLPTLFLLSLLFGVYEYASRRYCILRRSGCRVLIVIILQFLVVALFFLCHNSFLHRVMNYIIPYFIGVIAAEEDINFLVTGNKWLKSIAWLVFCFAALGFALLSTTCSDTLVSARCLRLIAGVASAFVFFGMFSRMHSGNLTRLLSFLGCNTLILYVLGDPLINYGSLRLLLVPFLNEFTVYPIAVVVSVFIAIPALLVGCGLKYIPVLNRLLLGMRR